VPHLATSAAPPYLKPSFADIPPPGGWYIDGGLKRNNPSSIAMDEARNYWETTKHFCIIRIGTGQQRTVNFIGDLSEELFADSPSLINKVTEAANTISKIPGAFTVKKIANIVPGVLTLKAFAVELVRLSTSADDAHEEMLKLARSHVCTGELYNF
jgi:patatin-like phospholipase/acyl hydrolase